MSPSHKRPESDTADREQPVNSHKPHKTAPEDRIPVHEKALYGLGSPALLMTTNVVDHQIQQVLVYGMGMSPAMKSVIVMIFRLWDSFMDPLMGWISDNTRTRFGRRRPYMFFGCLAMALIMPFVWRFNEGWDIIWIASWFTIGGMILSTATTVYNIPYQTLKMEMSPDYNERTSINVYSGIVIKLFSLVLPWIWAMTQMPFFTGQAVGEEPNTLLGIRNVAIWIAGFVILIGMVPTFICKERYYGMASKQKKEPLFRSFKLTFQSQPFRMMIIFILLLNMEGLVMGMGGYLTTYYVLGGDLKQAAYLTGIGGTASMILALLSIPFFGWLAGRVGKERSLFFIVLAQIAMACSILVFYNPNYPYLVLIPAALNGPMVAGLWTVVPSMKADIVDDDELRTGERREGSFESVFSWILKFAGTLFTGLSGFLVVLIGFKIDLKAEQAEGVFRNMILLMFSIPFLFSIIEAWIIYKWPLTAGVMEDIRHKLEARRGKIDMQSGGLSGSK
ncbi:MAG: MFS transporter [Puniceicoccaceae bacterium]